MTLISKEGECCPCCAFHSPCTPENPCCKCLIAQLQEEDADNE